MSPMNKRNLDKFKGCLIGGAIGDALGYPIEFLNIDEIHSEYSEKGIRDYKLFNGKALISDDTQMTLFTANGLLYGKANEVISGINGSYPAAIWGAYKDWLKTQCGIEIVPEPCCSWLLNVPELRARRAPGNTCISALMEDVGGSIKSPINDSKGCGGIMRVAPIGLFFIDKNIGLYKTDKIGAEVAALTHGHELGYIPAAALTHIIYSLASGEVALLEYAVKYSLTAVKKLFPEAVHLNEFAELIELAIELAHSKLPDIQAIKKLGEGWVAEETLAIAVYCSLKYQNDFENAIIAAVNHSGDSDSTGAVTGNILGAYLGIDKIPEKFVANLEMASLIEEIAEDLYTGYSNDEVWKNKYIDCDYIFDSTTRPINGIKKTISDLTKFIPLLKEDELGEWRGGAGGSSSAKRPIQMPYVNYSPLVMDFVKAVYEFVEDNKDLDLLNYYDIIKANNIKSFDKNSIDSLDLKSSLAIIVFCVRRERFCDGLLLANLKNGVIIKCLERIAVM